MGYFTSQKHISIYAFMLAGCSLYAGESQDQLAANTESSTRDPSSECIRMQEPQMVGGYNYSARDRLACPVNMYVDASFVYWQASQDDMNLAWSTNYPNGDIGGNDAFDTNLKGSSMDFDYHPGFRLGVGGFLGHDDWDLHAEYTWFHASNTKSMSVEGGAAATNGLYPSVSFPDWDGYLFNNASGKWKLQMDIADLDLGRWYYLGTKVQLHPTIGVRGAWISQAYNVNSIAVEGAFLNNQAAPIRSVISQNTHSWGVGPKVSLEGKWNLGCGFRLFGNGEADLLYTRYTKMSFKQDMTDLLTGLPYQDGGLYYPVNISQSDISCVRTHLDLNLGLGWGTHFFSDKYKLDFTAGYEMQVFFDQNMFFSFGSSSMYGSVDTPNGNLYLQGLTISSSFDF